ncbi:hypothetical protein CDL12_27150 [Handroanthus impetiginosus]|uniref:Uncharacterized protein n=1 Tax=Handroanthus impetiginosus TaxID=429701 RepID=A0A2G9G4V4_9LAMI|nr:hypothetical protein CDL12_27150 [Handroanthus impetiginosus]
MKPSWVLPFSCPCELVPIPRQEIAITLILSTMTRVFLLSLKAFFRLCQIMANLETERTNMWAMVAVENMILKEMKVPLQLCSLPVIRENIEMIQVWMVVGVMPVVPAGSWLLRLQIKLLNLNH